MPPLYHVGATAICPHGGQVTVVPTNTRERHDAYHWFLLELGIEEAELELRWADRVLSTLRSR